MLFFQECLCRKLSKTKNNRTSPVRNSFYYMRTMHIFREKRALSPPHGRCQILRTALWLWKPPWALTLFLFACSLPGGPDQAV